MIEGKIVKTGNLELIDYLEKEGYESFITSATDKNILTISKD
jgi:Fe-S cluster assembly ATPase SufC